MRSPSRRSPRASSGTSDGRRRRRSSSSPRPSCSRRSPTARRRRKQEQVSDVNALIKDLSELKVGDPVVHDEPRHRPLRRAEAHRPRRRRASEFLHLEYADKATLYVPVAQLHLISRYTGVSADEAPLHKLGSGQWDKARRKAAEQVRDTAAELLNLYARRAAREGYRVPLLAARLRGLRRPASASRRRADQQAAIHAVIQDMVSPQPMDRLVCGDVGFGKTEVALRAAFVAVHRRQAGRDPGADDAAGRAALPEHRRPLRQLAGQDRRAVALPLGQGGQGRRSKGSPTARSTSSSAPTSCSSRRRQVQAPRACSSSTRSTASACATRRR